MRRKSALSGSRGASSGAASAMKMMERPTRPPTADSVLRREKRASSTSNADLITGSPRPSNGLRLAVPSAIPDTRVEPRVAEVDQHIDHDEDHGVEQHEVLHDDDVALDHRDHERAPQPRHPERLLDRHRAAEHEAQEHAGDRDDGQQRVGQRVPHHDDPLAQSLRPRRPHEVLADDLEQTGPRHPRDIGALSEPEDEGGADHDLEVLPRALPEVDDHDRRLVAEPEQRGQHDQHAEPEARDGDEEDRQRARDAVGHAVRLERAQDADGRPTSHETNSASTPISALIGPRCAISAATVSPRKNDLPSRPAKMSPSQWTYCTGSGSLSPRSAMMRTRSAGAMCACPSTPRMATRGSPGRIRRITKMLRETPSSVTAAYTARRARYFRMLRVRRGMWGAPRGPPRQSSEPDVVPSDHVVDPEVGGRVLAVDLVVPGVVDLLVRHRDERRIGLQNVDRKSTRLNSSHSQISYAVFCL